MVRMRSAVRIRPAAPHKPCNHNGYRVCFILSFLGFVGLSNRSSNKLLLRLFLQRRNDQFGDVGIFLQQAVRLFRRVIQRFFLRHISPFPEEIRLHLLRQAAALLVVGMGVQICYHTGLGMAGITLHRLDVPAANLQLQRSAAMPQTVKDYRRQPCGIGQLAEQKGNLPFLVRASVLMGNDKRSKS